MTTVPIIDTLEEWIKHKNTVNERVIHKLIQAKVALIELTSLSGQFFSEELDASYSEEMSRKIDRLLNAALDERGELS